MKTFLLILLVSIALRTALAQNTPPADWAISCGTGSSPTSMAADPQGNTYVAGRFKGTITLGTTTLTAAQVYPGNREPVDVFLAKLTPQGQYLWAVQFGDGQSAAAGPVAVDVSGNVYVAGGFTSYSLQLGPGGPTLYNSSNNSEGFVASFSGQTGQCQWARRFGGAGYDSGNTLALNSSGDVYLAGVTGDASADLGPFTLPAASSSTYRQFLARLSPTGTWLWAQQPVDGSNLFVSNLIFDGQGSFYLVGGFASPSATLGSTTLMTGALSGGSAGSDILVAKYTEGGRLRWARQANPRGGSSQGVGRAAYDGQGHLFVVGSFSSQTARLGPFMLANTGPLLPTPTPAPPAPNSDYYYADAFAARLDTAGTWQWTTPRGSAGVHDYGYAAVLDGQGSLWGQYLSGTTWQLAANNPTTGAGMRSYSLPGPFYLINDQLGSLYVAGTFTAASLSLGGQTITGAGGNTATGYVARLGSLPLANHLVGPAGAGLQAWPTPGPGTGVWVQGAKAGQVIEAFDVLGRRVGGGTMPGSGPLRLNWAGAGLAPGVYILRGGAQSCRWVVE